MRTIPHSTLDLVYKLLLIGAGGAVGAILRYALSVLSYRMCGDALPWGTFAVNVFGCLAIGILWALAERTPFSPGTYLFVFTGVLGAFTTFSTYGLESLELLRSGRELAALANILASNIIGIGAAAAGFYLTRLVLTSGSP